MTGRSASTGSRFARACLGPVVVLVFAGCGTGATDGRTTPPGSTTATSESSPARSTPSYPRTTPGGQSHTKRHTLRGRLVEPVETGCVVLDTADGPYVLLGVPQDIRGLSPGTRVVVHGSIAESTMTTCQQGTPFDVDTAEPA